MSFNIYAFAFSVKAELLLPFWCLIAKPMTTKAQLCKANCELNKKGECNGIN